MRFLRKHALAVLIAALLLLQLPVFFLVKGLSDEFRRPWEINPGMFVRDPDLLWRLAPGFRAKPPLEMAINSLGYRGKEFAPRKRAGVYRVLCVGDSVTFGVGVNDELTYPARLERSLREAAGREVEAINGGVLGYGTPQELRYLRKEGLSLEPDLVILEVCVNDFDDNSITERYQLLREFMEKARAIRDGRKGKIHALVGEARIFFIRLGCQVKTVRLKLSGEIDPLAITASSLGQVKELCEKSGTPLLVVAFPHRGDARASRKLSAFLAAEAARLRLDLLDFFPPEGSERFSMLDEIHLSPEGCAAMAAALTAHLMRSPSRYGLAGGAHEKR